MKFDENFGITWQRQLHDATLGMDILDMDFSTKSGKFSAAIGIKEGGDAAGNDKTKLFIFNETTGDTIDEYEQTVAENILDYSEASIRIYPSDDRIVFAHQLRLIDDSNDANKRLYIGFADLASTTYKVSGTVGVKRFDTGLYGSAPQLEVIGTSSAASLIVFTMVQEPYCKFFLSLNYE